MKLLKNKNAIFCLATINLACASGYPNSETRDYPVEKTTTTAVNKYKIVDTGQKNFFNNSTTISKPTLGQPFFGQDANQIGYQPSYTDNGDGTISDNVTGLIWEKNYEVMTYNEAVKKVKTFKLANHTDWRLPTIKEAYSLILFSGVDVSSRNMTTVPEGGVPFIDTDYFDFKYGANGRRIIDSQILSSTVYRGKTMGRNETVFGVNMADGRIKGYPIVNPRQRTSGKEFTVRLVRGNTEYGKNNFKDNNDGTVSDLATNLVWQKSDSKKPMNWQDALKWAQQKNKEKYLGFSDWRLPNAKELHSILDYSRSPQATNSAAINPVFEISKIKDEGRNTNYPFYWSSTTHKNLRGGGAAVYICFGEALGFLRRRGGPGAGPERGAGSARRDGPPRGAGPATLVDAHGAGAQRAEWKVGDPADYPMGHGPQGDVVRIYHYARLVRDNENTNASK